MAHTNIDITDRSSEMLRFELLKKERDFWRDWAQGLQRELENIPEAICKYGYVEFLDRFGTKMKLVEEALPSIVEEEPVSTPLPRGGL